MAVSPAMGAMSVDVEEAFHAAARLARGAGRQVALSLSDAFCVDRHRDSFLNLVAGHVDILFANEAEITSLYQVDDYRAVVAFLEDFHKTRLLQQVRSLSLQKPQTRTQGGSPEDLSLQGGAHEAEVLVVDRDAAVGRQVGAFLRARGFAVERDPHPSTRGKAHEVADRNSKALTSAREGTQGSATTRFLPTLCASGSPSAYAGPSRRTAISASRGAASSAAKRSRRSSSDRPAKRSNWAKRSNGSKGRVSPCSRMRRARGIQSVSSPWMRWPTTS